MYADKLQADRVPAGLKICLGITYEYIQTDRLISEVRRAHVDAARVLRKTFISTWLLRTDDEC